MLKKLKKIKSVKMFWTSIALLILFLYNLIFSEDFFDITIKEGYFYGSAIDILKNAIPLMLIAMGMTLVIASKGIDISVGSICAISGAVAAKIIGVNEASELSYYVAVLAALFISLILGMWNGFLISRLKIHPIIATLILMVSGRYIARFLVVYYEPDDFLINGYIPILKFPFSIFLVVMIFLFSIFIVKRTAIGLFIKSVGINSTASRFSGINVKNIIFLTYAFSGLCAGIAGLIISSSIQCTYINNTSLNIELDAILAVVIGGNSLNGGKFSLISSCIGAIVIQIFITTVYELGITPENLYVFKALVVIFVCLVQSDKFRSEFKGRFGRREKIKNGQIKNT